MKNILRGGITSILIASAVASPALGQDKEMEADLSVSKVANPSPVVAGEPITYTVTVTNAGPLDADDVEVVDIMTSTAGLTLLSDTAPGGCVESPALVVTCDVGTITAAAGSVEFDIVVDVPALTPHNTTISNSISVRLGPAATVSDSNSSNDDFGPVVTQIVTQAEWDVTKYWNRGGPGDVNVSLHCDSVLMDSAVATPGVPVTLTATGFDYQSANCVVTEEVPDQTFVEYSFLCDIDPAVSSARYFCDVGNSVAYAEFRVRKRFVNGDTATSTTFHLECSNGEIQQLDTTPGEGLDEAGFYELAFFVEDFTPGELDCTISEEPLALYAPSYECEPLNNFDQFCSVGSESTFDEFGSGPCIFEGVDSVGAFDAINSCTIRNHPRPTLEVPTLGRSMTALLVFLLVMSGVAALRRLG